MILDRLKNVFIVFLISTAIIQTFELWFESASSRNFFYSFQAQTAQQTSLEEQNFLAPSTCVINFGNKTFKAIYKTDNSFKQIDKNIESIIEQVLKESNALQSVDLNWDDLLTSKSIIYQYNYPMKIDTLSKTLNTKTTINKSLVFDSIIIMPMLVYSTKIIFIDTDKQKISQYEMKNNIITQSIYDAIEKLQQTVAEPLYISTKQAKFDLFTQNLFIPQFTSNSTVCTQLEMIEPIQNQTTIEKKVNSFFDNPTAKWFKLDKHGAYMFSDQNVVVKYYETNVIEYSNYRSTSEKNIPDLSISYSVAQQILKKDITLDNNISLTDITKTSDGFIFNYDYVINNIPIVISEGLSEKLGMKHAIEITTANNMVKKYKRYVSEFKPNVYQEVKVDFLTALDKVVMGDQEIQNIMLIYSQNGGTATLNWLIKIDGKQYLQPTT